MAKDIFFYIFIAVLFSAVVFLTLMAFTAGPDWISEKFWPSGQNATSNNTSSTPPATPPSTPPSTPPATPPNPSSTACSEITCGPNTLYAADMYSTTKLFYACNCAEARAIPRANLVCFLSASEASAYGYTQVNC